MTGYHFQKEYYILQVNPIGLLFFFEHLNWSLNILSYIVQFWKYVYSSERWGWYSHNAQQKGKEVVNEYSAGDR